jgi:predicted dienelactone hydrolase
MRPFEIVYIVLIAWGALQHLYKKEKRKNSTLLYKIIFSTFLIHFFLEQYRWQMLPAYLLGITLVFNYNKNIPHTMKTLLLIFLLIATSIPALVPVIKMPPLRGKYIVGSTTHHWIDAQRQEWFTDEPNDLRQIMVQFWYPGKKHKTSTRTPYLDKINLRAETMAKAGKFPKQLIKHLELTKTNSYLDLQADPIAAPLPVVIISHGITGMRHIHTALAEKLSNNGYLVVAVDHSYDANLSIFPDGSTANYRSDITGLPDSVTIRRNQINTRESDISFIISQLQKIQTGTINHQLNGFLDLDRIAVAGHSYGGGTSVLASYQNSQIKAALLLDGWMNPLPQKVIENGIDQPLIYIGRPKWSDSDYPTNTDLVAKLMKNSKGKNYYLNINGTLHLNYCDAPLFSPLAKYVLDVGEMDGQKSVNLINEISLQFFDQHLRADSKQSKILNKIEKHDEIVFN